MLRLDPRLAPVKAAVLPLSRNAALSPVARDLAARLRREWNVDFDDAGAIGRRYRRQDEIGTPYCVTVDFDTLEDQAVTVRERDAMTQERVSLDAVHLACAASPDRQPDREQPCEERPHGHDRQPAERRGWSSRERDLRRPARVLGLRPAGRRAEEQLKRQWWKAVVQGRDDVVGLDSCVILAREVWQTSGM